MATLTNRDPGDETVVALTIYRREALQVRPWSSAREEWETQRRVVDTLVAERDAARAALVGLTRAVEGAIYTAPLPDGLWSACWDARGREAFNASWADRCHGATEAEAVGALLARERDRAAVGYGEEGERS